MQHTHTALQLRMLAAEVGQACHRVPHRVWTFQLPPTQAKHVELAVQDALVRAGIQPDEHILYPSSAFVTAVEEQLGAQPLVHCVKGRLTEVRPG